MELSKLISAETPFYIVGLLAVIYYLQRQIDRLEKKIDEYQKQVVGLHGIAVAARACPVKECKVRDLRPHTVFNPTPQEP